MGMLIAVTLVAILFGLGTNVWIGLAAWVLLLCLPLWRS